MKKLLCLLIGIIFVFTLCSCGKSDSSTTTSTESGEHGSVTEEVENTGKVLDDPSAFDYSEVDGGIAIIDFRNRNSTEYDKIIIPSEIDGIKVVGIGVRGKGYNVISSVFGRCEVVIPDTVEYIAEEAFQNAKGLVHLSGGTNCKEICNFAFRNCINLEKVDFLDTVDTVGENAFSGCTAWENAHS